MAVPDEPATAAAGEPIGRAALPQRLAALDALVESGTISAADHAAYLEAIGDAPPPPSPDDYYRLLGMKVASFNFFRSEERRVGKACVSKCSYRWSPYP